MYESNFHKIVLGEILNFHFDFY